MAGLSMVPFCPNPLIFACSYHIFLDCSSFLDFNLFAILGSRYYSPAKDSLKING